MFICEKIFACGALESILAIDTYDVMHLQFTDIKITIKTGLSHKGIDNGDVSGLGERGGGGSRKGGGKNIDFWEVISLSPVMMGG